MKMIFSILILFITFNVAAVDFDMSKRNLYNSFYGKHILPVMFEDSVNAVSYDAAEVQLFGSDEYITLTLSGTDYKYFAISYNDVNSWKFREATGLLTDESGEAILTESGEAIIIE